MTFSRRRAVRALMGGAALASLLPAARAGEPVPPGTVLKVGDQKGGCQSVLQAAGALADLPYRIEWSQFPAAAPLLEALNAGAVDVAYAADSPTTFALAAGVPGKIIGAFRSSGAGTAIVVPPASPIRTVADLRGRRIGTNRGSIGAMLVTALAQREGWAPGTVTVANLLPADAKAALAAGAIDAWSTWAPYVAQAVLDGGARIIVNGGDGLLSGLDMQTASDAAIAGKHAALLDYLRRHGAARRWATSHMAEFAHEWAGEIGVSEAVARLSFRTQWPLLVAIDDGVLRAEQRTADLLAAGGVLHRKLETGGYFDRSFAAAVAT
jgi:sulfonate transport system substrate-binding protein